MVIGKINNLNVAVKSATTNNQIKRKQSEDQKNRLDAVRANLETTRLERQQKTEDREMRLQELRAQEMQLKKHFEKERSKYVKAEKDRQNSSLKKTFDGGARRSDIKRRNSISCGFGSSTPRSVCTPLSRSSSMSNCSSVGREITNKKLQSASSINSFSSINTTQSSRSNLNYSPNRKHSNIRRRSTESTSLSTTKNKSISVNCTKQRRQSSANNAFYRNSITQVKRSALTDSANDRRTLHSSETYIISEDIFLSQTANKKEKEFSSKIPVLNIEHAKTIARRRSARNSMHDTICRVDLELGNEEKLNEIRILALEEGKRQLAYEKDAMKQKKRLSFKSTLSTDQNCSLTENSSQIPSPILKSISNKKLSIVKISTPKKSNLTTPTKTPLAASTKNASPTSLKVNSTTPARTSPVKISSTTLAKNPSLIPDKLNTPKTGKSPVSTTPSDAANKKSLAKSTLKRISTPEEAKLALAERRRAARIAVQLKAAEEAEVERLRQEAEEFAEQERVAAEAEEQKLLEEEAERLAEFLRKAEKIRLQEAIAAEQYAIAEAERKYAEENVRKENEEKERDEREKSKLEELERKRITNEERAKKEEFDRAERKRRVDAIMARTRGSTPNKHEENKGRAIVTAV